MLNVYITSDIVNNDCKPHPQSPLVVDVNLGRSAGRIFFDEKTKSIIRPSQICENSYGEGIAFSELKLSPKSIVIKQLNDKLITPRNYREFKKVHHIDKFRNLTVLDLLDEKFIKYLISLNVFILCFNS